MNLVICETTAAIARHLRDATLLPQNLSGFSTRPVAFCGVVVSWDTTGKPSTATCRACIDEAKKRAQ